jgi:serine/threonine protein kinase
VAQGLEYLHGGRIIHGDMKGVSVFTNATFRISDSNLRQLNILISRSGRACLADFGLATARDSKPIIMTYMTTGKTTGTLRWQAPELFAEMQSLNPESPQKGNTPATDVYAYGLVCYEVNHSLKIPRNFTDDTIDVL